MSFILGLFVNSSKDRADQSEARKSRDYWRIVWIEKYACYKCKWTIYIILHSTLTIFPNPNQGDGELDDTVIDVFALIVFSDKKKSA